MRPGILKTWHFVRKHSVDTNKENILIWEGAPINCREKRVGHDGEKRKVSLTSLLVREIKQPFHL